ncbi:hypothetical protein FOMPIDRAFT_1056654 [Fomitopsis schrenkii]|uniref:Uncharacterized protein n=1 Tax=Fomitopsis schrenkii TaxID=2126942 RepID=S8F0X7_FOMSC|nr:hypothetical protein FOMPIDRAFT_1056654 [Fomitopsis schrenkii]
MVGVEGQSGTALKATAARDKLPTQRSRPHIRQDWSGRAPNEPRRGRAREDYLQQLNSDRRYQAVFEAWLSRPALDAGGGLPKPTRVPVLLPFASWGTWSYADTFMAEEVHASPEAATKLCDGIQGRPWMAGRVISWPVVEQVLLAVGLAIRDIHTSQFTHDPEEPLPPGVPEYVVTSNWTFAHVDMLLDTLQLVLDDATPDTREQEGRENAKLPLFFDEPDEELPEVVAPQPKVAFSFGGEPVVKDDDEDEEEIMFPDMPDIMWQSDLTRHSPTPPRDEPAEPTLAPEVGSSSSGEVGVQPKAMNPGPTPSEPAVPPRNPRWGQASEGCLARVDAE